jgi:CHAT domain-containing protein/tetratricopeptide (TPR) repeat protein
MWNWELLVALALWQKPGPAVTTETPPLTIGSVVSGRLADAQSTARYHVVIRTGDVIELSLESYDFDARVRVERENGDLVAEDDDSGVETDAKLVVGPGVEGKLVVVASSKDLGGEFDVALREQGTLDTSKHADVVNRVAWRTTAESRAVQSGNVRRGASHALARAQILERANQFEPALGALDRCIELATSCADLKTQLQALTSKGQMLDKLGKPELARASFDSCVELAKQSGDRAMFATSLGNLGTHVRRRGDLGFAEECFRQDRDICLELEDSYGAAMAEGNIGRVLRAAGRADEAAPLLESALAAAVTLHDRAAEAGLALELGHLLFQTGKLSPAITKFARARELYTALGDEFFAAASLVGTSNVQRVRGEYAEARRGFDVALDTARRLSAPSLESVARSGLAILDLHVGNYAAAAEGFEFERAQSQRNGDQAGVARSTLNLATVHIATGATTAALDALLSCLETSRACGFEIGEGLALGNLGFVHETLGDLGESLRCHTASLEFFVRQRDVAAAARAHGGLGNTLASMGRLEEAKSHFIEQLNISQRIGDPLGAASAMANMSGVDLRLGDHRAALDGANKAASVFREHGVRPLLIQPLLVLASSSIVTGDAGSATSALVECEELLSSVSGSALLDQSLLGLRDKYRSIDYASQDLTALRLAEAGSSTNAGRAALDWGFEAAGRWKGHALLSGIAEHRRGAHSAAVIELRTQRNDALAAHSAALDQLAQAIRLEQPAIAIESLRRHADETLSETKRLADELRGLSPRDASLDIPKGVTFDDVRKNVLGPNDILVDYVDGEHRIYAYCVSHDSAEFFDLGTKKEIAADVDAFLSGITERERRAPPATIAATGRALFDRLLAPLLASVGGQPTRLVIVPNGLLSTVPFEALVMNTRRADPVSFADLEFVIDRFDVTYGPSSPVLVELSAIGPRSTPGKLLLLADPIYERESTTQVAAAEPPDQTILGRRSPPPSLSLDRIQKTRSEAFAITDALIAPDDDEVLLALARLRTARSGSARTALLDLHLGADASRDRIATDMREYAVIHLACHGYIDTESPRRSGLVFSATKDLGGWFTIADALELDLDANLVVLSACQTARGGAISTDGVESMARAFLYSGARAVVASLWDVDDAAAAETMARAYDLMLREHKSSAAALLDAKRFVRSNRLARSRPVKTAGESVDAETGHPNLWAPFIHIGLAR